MSDSYLTDAGIHNNQALDSMLAVAPLNLELQVHYSINALQLKATLKPNPNGDLKVGKCLK